MQTRTQQLTIGEVSDRLDRLPASRFHAKVLIVAALSLLFDTLDTAVTGFVLASLRDTWHFDAKAIGIVSAVGLSGYLVGSAICGFVADHIGRKKTILFTLILYSVFSAGRGFSNTLGVFAFLNFFTWFFVGAESSTVPTYLAELWPARTRGKLVGWMMSFFGTGIALSSVWALLIIPTLGWRWALFLTAPFALIGGVMRWALPESPRWLIRAGRPSDAEAVLLRIEGEVSKSSGQFLTPVIPGQSGQELSTRRADPRELLGAAYLGVTLMLWAAWFAEYGVLYTYQIFLPTILSAEGHSIVKSFRYSVVIYSSVIPGYVLGGYVVEWLDRKYTILLSFVSIAAFGTLFGYSRSPAQIMTFAGLTVFFLSLGSTAIYTYTPELHPTEIRATAMGIASAWGRVGAVTMLLVFGHFFAILGKSLLFLMIDPVLIVAAIVVLCFGPSTRGKPLQETQFKPNSLPPAGYYNANYGNFQTELYAQIRREAFGEDIGQNSWLTADEQDRFLQWLDLSSGKTLLDVACGAGGPALRIAASTGCSVVGIDVHEQAVKTASSLVAQRGLAERAEFRTADASGRLPFPDASFDVITCIDAINHFSDRPRVIAEWARLIKVGGRILFTDPITLTGPLTNEEVAVRSSAGVYLFVPHGYDEGVIAQCGLQLLVCEDVTANMAKVAEARRAAREARSAALREIEGDQAYDGQQEFLDVAARLAREGRLSRFVYVSQKLS